MPPGVDDPDKMYAVRSGDFVTTGSHTGLVTAPLHATVVARFAAIGESQLTLVG